jgi:hypothetical protein
MQTLEKQFQEVDRQRMTVARRCVQSMFQVRTIDFNVCVARDHVETFACVSRNPTILPLVLLLPLTFIPILTQRQIRIPRIAKQELDVAELQQKIKNKNSEMQLMKRMEDLVLWRKNHLQQK